MILLLVLLILRSSANATPSIDLPINSQVPPVAVVDQAYSYVFSASTFTSASGSINYGLGNNPSWLQLDTSSRTFYGTPESNDVRSGGVGSFTVDLIATDESGSATIPATFVVTTDPGPGLGISVAAQLPAFGAFSSPNVLLLTPGNALSLTFSPDTFTNTNENTFFYAMCANNTPLPSWISFDPSSLTFSGTAPQATSPSELRQSFGILLSASNVAGFSQSTASFELTVESHMFVFGNDLQIINATIGSFVNFTGLRHDLTLDGQPIQPSDLRNIVGNAPSWLSLSNGTLALSGTPPPHAHQQNFTITATDKYGDAVSTLVLIQIADNSSFTLIDPVPPLNATIGTNFTYVLNDSIPPAKFLNISVDPGTASAWLEYNSTSSELYGHVPYNLKPQTVQANITVTQEGRSQSQIIDILVGCGNSLCPVTGGHSSTPKATEGARNLSQPNRRGNRGWIAAAVIVPVAAIAGLLVLLCYCRRRAKKSQQTNKVRKVFASRGVEAEKDSILKAKHGAYWHVEQDQERRSLKIPEMPEVPSTLSAKKNGKSIFRLSKNTTEDVHRSPRPDSWQRYITKLQSPRETQSVTVPDFSIIHEEQSLTDDTTSDISQTNPIANGTSRPTGDIVFTRGNPQRNKPASNFNSSRDGTFSDRPKSGLGHGRIRPSQGNRSLCFVTRGVGHGGGRPPSGPPGWGVVRKSWRNLSRLSWTSTQSPVNSADPVMEEGFERAPTQKSFNSLLASFPRPSTSATGDHFVWPQLREASHDRSVHMANPQAEPLPLDSSKTKSNLPFRRKDSTNDASLQDFHKRRLKHSTSRNPLFSAHLSSSRKSSVHISQQTPEDRSTSNPNLTSTRPQQTKSRSYSQSSSLEPPPSTKSSPARSSKSISSPYRKKSHINYRLTPRALSPLRRSQSSYASTNGSSKFSDPVNATPFYPYGGALLEDTDDEGNKHWRHPAHPNPLGTNRTYPASATTDLNDQELVESLRAAGQYSAAERLDYLRAHTVGGGGNGGGDAERVAGDDATVEVRSARGRKLDHQAGLHSDNSGLKSLKGDIWEAGGSAFM